LKERPLCIAVFLFDKEGVCGIIYIDEIFVRLTKETMENERWTLSFNSFHSYFLF